MVLQCSSLKSFPLVILTKLVIIPLKEQKMGSHAAGPFPELRLETGETNLVLNWPCGCPTQRHQTAFSCPSKMSSMCICRGLGHGCWVARDKALSSPFLCSGATSYLGCSVLP